MDTIHRIRQEQRHLTLSYKKLPASSMRSTLIGELSTLSPSQLREVLNYVKVLQATYMKKAMKRGNIL